jgi:hypothetical protein
MREHESLGTALAGSLRDSLRAYRVGPATGGRKRPVVWGVTDKGTFVGGMTADAFLDRAGEILLESAKVFRFGNSIVYECPGPTDPRLSTLAVQHRPEPHAAGVLANLFAVGVEAGTATTQSLVPQKLINALLVDEPFGDRLPEIRHYSRRPCFDPEFNPCRPGWNAGSGILVHADEVPPAVLPPVRTEGRAADRLPEHLRALLGEFGWRTDADLVNAVALLLTGLLINHFVEEPHPVGILDGNQPAVGKTLLAQTIGRVLDGAEPPRIPLVHDEELEKRLCAQLRGSRTSLFFIDNVRTHIESMILEQNVLSPLLSFRVLGRSATIERPNTFLWLISSNLTAGTPDLISRGVPVRLYHEGDPKKRRFRGNPLAYAARHRTEALGEMAAMVLRWVERGKMPGAHRHRCEHWAAVIGGILDANGLGEFFLGNLEDAEAQMDQGLQDLATLAEHVVAEGLTDLWGPPGAAPATRGKPARHWVAVAADAQILRDKLGEGTPKGKTTVVGIFFSARVDRAVPIETSAGRRTATLRRQDAGSGQTLYSFEVAEPRGAAAAARAPAEASDVPSGLGSRPKPASPPRTGDVDQRPPGSDTRPAGGHATPAGRNGRGAEPEPEWF